MNYKYEVTYYNWMKGEEITELCTNSLIKALLTVHDLHKDWYCVTVKFRHRDMPRNRKGVASWTLPSKS